MRRLLLWSVLAGFVACLNQPTLATIDPDYAYFDSDGCVAVTIQGHHLGTAATVRIGDAPIIGLTPAAPNPDVPEHAQDVGFLYSGFIPRSSSGASGWTDVVMEVDGETLTISEGFYYRTCPGDAHVDAYTLPYAPGYSYYDQYPDYTVDPAQDISLEGCGLDPAATTVEYTDIVTAIVTSVPVTQGCPFSSATVDIPDLLAPGDYTAELVRGATRTRLSPYRCGVSYTATYYEYYYDTGADPVCPFDMTIAGVVP